MGRLDENLGDDFIIPLRVVARGFRVIFDPDVAVSDQGPGDPAAGFRQKYRIVTKDFRGLLTQKQMLDPFTFGLVSWTLISHKLLRWFVPYFLTILLLASAFLIDRTLASLVVIWGAAAFAALAAVGLLLEKSGKQCALFTVPLYFSLVNGAAFAGIIMSVLGRKIGCWSPERD